MIGHAIELLRAFPQLDYDTSMPEEKTINFDRVLEEKQHVYAYLCAIGNIAARQIGSTMLSCLLAAAIARTEETTQDGKPLPKRRVWLVIDEAPLIVSSYFATFLANCRKYGITPILVAQDSTQFEDK
jgi:type IV secretory pathway TraG/TraD family ATPase VirD4